MKNGVILIYPSVSQKKRGKRKNNNDEREISRFWTKN
jgi:hypothetical protein